MSPQDTYRHRLLTGQLPPLHSRARRRLVAGLRFEAGLPLWMYTAQRPPAALPELIEQVRKHGAAWHW